MRSPPGGKGPLAEEAAGGLNLTKTRPTDSPVPSSESTNRSRGELKGSMPGKPISRFLRRKKRTGERRSHDSGSGVVTSQ